MAVGATPGASEAKPALLVYGEGFVFGVSEPLGWKGDTEKAGGFHVNIVFFPSSPESRNADVTIRVRLNRKVDENTAADLQYDMDEYKQNYPKVQFSDLSFKHPSYPVFEKVFFVPKSFFEYVAYLNPGAGVKFTLSAAMSVRGRAASEAELSAFESVVASLKLLKPAPAG